MATGVSNPLHILFLGASFGAVLGMRIASAGHKVTFVSYQDEAKFINAGKIFLRLPAKNLPIELEIGAAQCTQPPDALAPDDVDLNGYDMVCLAMQEPQYSSADVRELIYRIAATRIRKNLD